jgi:hypothetical protein
MTRTTMKQLNTLIEVINKEAKTPLSYCDRINDPPFKINVGHYHIDSAYGGYKLVQTVNDSGGIRTVTHSGYITKSNLYNELYAFLCGLKTREIV